MTTFERIKELSRKKSKSLQQVARDLQYGENYFYSLNAGKQPTAEKLAEIADYFDVSVDYLLGRDDDGIKKSEVKMLARKMESLDDTELKTLDNLVNQFFDLKFGKGPDQHK